MPVLKKITYFFKLIRYPNLFIIILTQFLTFNFLNGNHQPVINVGILLLISGSVLIAAAGYLINDFFDVEIDKINKPGKLIWNAVFSRKLIITLYSILNLIAVCFGLLLGPRIFFLFIFTIMLLALYSAYFKRIYIAGNLAVSLMLGLTVYIVWIFLPAAGFEIVFFYTSFAFISCFIREVVKDIEDIEGDSEHDCMTLPVVAGIKASKNVTLALIALLILLIESTFLYLYLTSFPNSLITAIYLNIFTILPLLMIAYRLIKATERNHYHQISNYIKIVMLTGIFSILILKINCTL
jgi:4-hydroxybenzoate polyprenyltransferase